MSKKLKEIYPDLYGQAEGKGSDEEFIITFLGYMKVIVQGISGGFIKMIFFRYKYIQMNN